MSLMLVYQEKTIPQKKIDKVTWEDLTDFYIGQIGIDPNNFWSNTWKENILLSEAHSIQINLDWERTRFLATMIHNVNCSKKSQMLQPESLFKLPQDFKTQTFKSSKEQYEQFLAKVESVKNKH